MKKILILVILLSLSATKQIDATETENTVFLPVIMQDYRNDDKARVIKLWADSEYYYQIDQDSLHWHNADQQVEVTIDSGSEIFLYVNNENGNCTIAYSGVEYAQNVVNDYPTCSYLNE